MLRKIVVIISFLIFVLCLTIIFSNYRFTLVELIEKSHIPHSYEDLTESQKKSVFYVDALIYIVLGGSFLILIFGFVRPLVEKHSRKFDRIFVPFERRIRNFSRNNKRLAWSLSVGSYSSFLIFFIYWLGPSYWPVALGEKAWVEYTGYTYKMKNLRGREFWVCEAIFNIDQQDYRTDAIMGDQRPKEEACLSHPEKEAIYFPHFPDYNYLGERRQFLSILSAIAFVPLFVALLYITYSRVRKRNESYEHVGKSLGRFLFLIFLIWYAAF